MPTACIFHEYPHLPDLRGLDVKTAIVDAIASTAGYLLSPDHKKCSSDDLKSTKTCLKVTHFEVTDKEETSDAWIRPESGTENDGFRR